MLAVVAETSEPGQPVCRLKRVGGRFIRAGPGRAMIRLAAAMSSWGTGRTSGSGAARTGARQPGAYEVVCYGSSVGRWADTRVVAGKVNP
jgi:hypothetical protein